MLMGGERKVGGISGRSRHSRTLMAGDRREMGLYEVDEEDGLPALGMGMMIAFFQMAGRSARDTERL